jgi:phosphomannomutase
MIPFLLVTRLVSQTGRSLADLVGEMVANYPCSGEINRKVPDVKGTIAQIQAKYEVGGKIEHIDGLSLEYSDWRFNLRGSNTEPVIRLNVESRGDRQLMEDKTAELLESIGGEPIS